jgi:hypothetical protein
MEIDTETRSARITAKREVTGRWAKIHQRSGLTTLHSGRQYSGSRTLRADERRGVQRPKFRVVRDSEALTSDDVFDLRRYGPVGTPDREFSSPY